MFHGSTYARKSISLVKLLHKVNKLLVTVKIKQLGFPVKDFALGCNLQLLVGKVELKKGQIKLVSKLCALWH
jgi:hypoxanthine-guanine phosphoribosyltransferase